MSREFFKILKGLLSLNSKHRKKKRRKQREVYETPVRRLENKCG